MIRNAVTNFYRQECVRRGWSNEAGDLGRATGKFRLEYDAAFFNLQPKKGRCVGARVHVHLLPRCAALRALSCCCHAALRTLSCCCHPATAADTLC